MFAVQQYFDSPGKRIFDIEVKSIPFPNVDLVQLGGGVPFKALQLPFATLVEDGFLTIKLISTGTDNPSKFIASIKCTCLSLLLTMRSSFIFPNKPKKSRQLKSSWSLLILLTRFQVLMAIRQSIEIVVALRMFRLMVGVVELLVIGRRLTTPNRMLTGFLFLPRN